MVAQNRVITFVTMLKDVTRDSGYMIFITVNKVCIQGVRRYTISCLGLR